MWKVTNCLIGWWLFEVVCQVQVKCQRLAFLRGTKGQKTNLERCFTFEQSLHSAYHLRRRSLVWNLSSHIKVEWSHQYPTDASGPASVFQCWQISYLFLPQGGVSLTSGSLTVCKISNRQWLKLYESANILPIFIFVVVNVFQKLLQLRGA